MGSAGSCDSAKICACACGAKAENQTTDAVDTKTRGGPSLVSEGTQSGTAAESDQDFDLEEMSVQSSLSQSQSQSLDGDARPRYHRGHSPMPPAPSTREAAKAVQAFREAVKNGNDSL